MGQKIEADATYGEMNARGRDDASALIERIKNEEAPFLLGHRVKLMIEGGTYGAYEIGFFQAVASNL